jgi:hypothetical protein
VIGEVGVVHHCAAVVLDLDVVRGDVEVSGRISPDCPQDEGNAAVCPELDKVVGQRRPIRIDILRAVD